MLNWATRNKNHACFKHLTDSASFSYPHSDDESCPLCSAINNTCKYLAIVLLTIVTTISNWFAAVETQRPVYFVSAGIFFLTAWFAFFAFRRWFARTINLTLQRQLLGD